jgi:hypothetical protein
MPAHWRLDGIGEVARGGFAQGTTGSPKCVQLADGSRGRIFEHERTAFVGVALRRVEDSGTPKDEAAPLERTTQEQLAIEVDCGVDE